MAHPVQIKVAGGAVQQVDFVHQLVPLGGANEVGQGGVVGLNDGGGSRLGVGIGGEVDDLPVLAVVHTLELLAAANGPVHGVGVDAQLLLQLLTQLEGVPGLPVHLVDEGEDGDVPHGAHLEEFSCLGLYALGGVDDHDGAVGGHEGAVGVLGEVLVAGGVQNVDAEALVLELHHGRGDGNTALLLDLHPVGGGGAGVLLALDRVGDNGEGAAALDLRFVIRQKGPLPLHLIFTGFNKLFYHRRTQAARGEGGAFSCILWGEGLLPVCFRLHPP